MITSENFLYSEYTNGDYRAVISLCAMPENLEFFSISLIDTDNKEISSLDFECVNEACDFINRKYNEIWDFKDKSEVSSDGCSTCTAH